VFSRSGFAANYLRFKRQTMQHTAYRLGEYKIIEDEHGDLWWETHIGLGSSKSGKCFINGDILFIKPGASTGPGFLKGEFLDHLNKLPKWEKTKYYCASYKICECKSGRRKSYIQGLESRLQDEAILKKNGSTQRKVADTRRKSFKVDTTEHISYKLDRYEITEMNHGQLFWKSYSGLGSLKKGRCHIKGSILFLEPGETELPSLRRREFMQQLIRLPGWKRTKYFCTNCAIYYSNTGAICRSLGEEKDLNGTQNVVANYKTYGAGINIEPIIVNKGDKKEKLEALFKTLVMLILKLLFGCFQIVYEVSRAIIEKWTQFRG
jgi:hypothetical protein